MLVERVFEVVGLTRDLYYAIMLLLL